MSEVKTMSSIQFPNTQQPYQVNDARIPADPGAYKYMATDGEGKWVAEDRLGYAMPPVQTVVVEEQVVAFAEQNGLAFASVVPQVDAIEQDQKYTVKFDGQTYICTSYFSSLLRMDAIGNEGIYTGESGKVEPFLATIFNGALMVYAQKPAGNYSFGVTMDFVAKKKIDGSFLPNASTSKRGAVIFGEGKNAAARVINTYFDATYEELLEANNAYKLEGAVWRIAGDTVCSVFGSIISGEATIHLVRSFAEKDVAEDVVIIQTDPENKTVISMERYASYRRIVFKYDGTNYTCNVPFEEFEVAVMSGLPMSYVETHNKKSTTAVTALFSTDINGWIVQANDLYDEAVKRLMVTEDSVGEYEA